MSEAYTRRSTEPHAAETSEPRVYIDAARWVELLRALQAANGPPPDQAAALGALIHFLDSIPAVREHHLSHSLHLLAVALPDLLRLAACWNQLTTELLAPGASDASMPEVACTQLRAVLRFANSVGGKQISALLVPLTELQAEADLEAQRWQKTAGCE